MKTRALTDTDPAIDIHGICEPTICTYFTSLNQGEFTRAAELFVAQGRLEPPCGDPIEGRAEIAEYLAAAAPGMRFCPTDGQHSIGINNYSEYQLQGQVEINWFTINVSWWIQLTAEQEIVAITVKLLTSPDDLLSFSRV